MYDKTTTRLEETAFLKTDIMVTKLNFTSGKSDFLLSVFWAPLLSKPESTLPSQASPRSPHSFPLIAHRLKSHDPRYVIQIVNGLDRGVGAHKRR